MDGQLGEHGTRHVDKIASREPVVERIYLISRDGVRLDPCFT